MTSRFTEVAVGATNPRRLAEFWCAVLDYKIIDANDHIVEIAPQDYPSAWTDDATREWKGSVRTAPVVPTILFAKVPEAKTIKNRLHMDVCPLGPQDEEVERILQLGATRADVGQGEVSWVVMQDPEGNEFCVLSSVQADPAGS